MDLHKTTVLTHNELPIHVSWYIKNVLNSPNENDAHMCLSCELWSTAVYTLLGSVCGYINGTLLYRTFLYRCVCVGAIAFFFSTVAHYCQDENGKVMRTKIAHEHFLSSISFILLMSVVIFVECSTYGLYGADNVRKCSVLCF